MSTWMEIMRVLCAQTKHYLRHASSPKETTAAATTDRGRPERASIHCVWMGPKWKSFYKQFYVYISLIWLISLCFICFPLSLSLLPYNKLSIVSRIGFNFIFIWYNSVLFFYCSTVSYDASTNSLGGIFSHSHVMLPLSLSCCAKQKSELNKNLQIVSAVSSSVSWALLHRVLPYRDVQLHKKSQHKINIFSRKKKRSRP